MIEIGLRLALEFRDNPLGQYLAEFNAPLVEGVKTPDDALCKNRVLIKRDEFTQRCRCKFVGKNSVRWSVAFKNSMGHERIRCAFSLHLFRSLTEGERLGLSEDICQQHVMLTTQRIERFVEGYEIARDESGSLMNQLVERVLSVCSGFTPVDGCGLIGDFSAVKRDVLAVALHRQLLQISRESLQVLLVR